MNRKNIVTLIITLLLIGCSTIGYTPNTSKTNTIEAKAIVKLIVQEQPGELAPIKVEITDRYFKMYATKSNPANGYIIPWNTVVYFNNIGKIELKQEKKWSKKWYVISIIDRNQNLRYSVYSSQENNAKLFIDALFTLKTDKIKKI